MLASDIMTRTLVTVKATTSVPEAATLLASRGFTALPVVDDDRALIGLLTEIDILRDRLPHDLASTALDEAASRRPPCGSLLTVGGVMTSLASVGAG